MKCFKVSARGRLVRMVSTVLVFMLCMCAAGQLNTAYAEGAASDGPETEMTPSEMIEYFIGSMLCMADRWDSVQRDLDAYLADAGKISDEEFIEVCSNMFTAAGGFNTDLMEGKDPSDREALSAQLWKLVNGYFERFDLDNDDFISAEEYMLSGLEINLSAFDDEDLIRETAYEYYCAALCCDKNAAEMFSDPANWTGDPIRNSEEKAYAEKTRKKFLSITGVSVENAKYDKRFSRDELFMVLWYENTWNTTGVLTYKNILCKPVGYIDYQLYCSDISSYALEGAELISNADSAKIKETLKARFPEFSDLSFNTAAPAGYVTVLGGTNVREQPDSGSSKAGCIDSDSRLPYYEYKGGWYKIQLSDGTMGYVYESRIRK